MTGDDAPYFSIVTATYDAAPVVERLRESLLEQTEPSWEWIVQDGASRDGTLEAVAASDEPRITAESAPDSGIYDGLNRALVRVRGRYVLVLGADDTLADASVLSRLRDAAEAAGEPEVVLGAARIGDHEVFRSTLGVKTLVVNTVHHQGAAYRADQFHAFTFDPKARVVADYEHSLLLYLRRATRASSELLISVCGPEGVSRRTDERRLYVEMHGLRRKHLASPLSALLLGAGLLNVRRRDLQRRIGNRPGSGR